MAKKLIQGDKIPRITLNLVDGRQLVLPDAIDSRYLAVIFYRGNWCPYCVRHLLSFQEKLGELWQLGAKVVAATADTRETTEKLVAERGIAFPVAYGVRDEDIADMDPWWTDDHHGHYVQPLELLLLRGGTVFGSLYASGPVGRLDVNEVLTAIRNREKRRIEQEQQATPASG